MILADAAQAVDGKLYILGGGWSVTGPGPTPFAIAVKVEVPWDQANQQHGLRIELLNADGQPVEVPHPPNGELQRVVIEGELEVGRPPGLKPGTPLDSVLAVNFPNGLPLPPGSRYVWRLMIDGHTEEQWACSFTTRPGQPPSK